MAKAKSRFKNWEQEVKAGVEKIAGAEKERDEVKKEAQVARLATVVAGDAKAKANDDLVGVQEALAVVEEARRKENAKTSYLEIERTSFLL